MRIYRAARCSAAGIGYAFRHESAFRMEVCLCALLIPGALWLTQDPLELLVLIVPLLLVLCVECINSAVEATVDRISEDIHPLSKQAKDLGSAAVFISMLIVALCWLAVLYRQFVA